MKKSILLTILFILSNAAYAEVGLQLSGHHQYWKSGIEDEGGSNALVLGVALAYIDDRFYYTGAYSYNAHSRDRDFGDGKASETPLTEVDIGMGYHFATNISGYFGYRYQNIDYKDNIQSNDSFYESGHGLGLGVKFNQLMTKDWVLYESFNLSTLWMNNKHESLDIGGYQDYSLNAMLGILYRITPAHSITLDVSYKKSWLTHDEETLGGSRSYFKTGMSIIVVF